MQLGVFSSNDSQYRHATVFDLTQYVPSTAGLQWLNTLLSQNMCPSLVNQVKFS